MATKLHRLPEFIDAVNNELKALYEPNRHDGWARLLLGERIFDVRSNRIKEDEYIAKWESK